MTMNGTPSSPRVGQLAPTLELPTLDGGLLRLTDLRGRPALVSFLRHGG